MSKGNMSRCLNDCKKGIKALQNISGCLAALSRLSEIFKLNDNLYKSSLFHLAVIRYGKCFSNMKSREGDIRYSIKQLKVRENFSRLMHDHLMELRDTLIAHDDFTYVEPRIAAYSINLENSPARIPLSIAITNKCISYPSKIKSVINIIEHVKVVEEGMLEKLISDMQKYRQYHITEYEDVNANLKYLKHIGKVHLPKDGRRIDKMDLGKDEYLNIDVPKFLEDHEYVYEERGLQVNFDETERIVLPDGRQISIKK